MAVSRQQSLRAKITMTPLTTLFFFFFNSIALYLIIIFYYRSFSFSYVIMLILNHSSFPFLFWPRWLVHIDLVKLKLVNDRLA